MTKARRKEPDHCYGLLWRYSDNGNLAAVDFSVSICPLKIRVINVVDLK